MSGVEQGIFMDCYNDNYCVVIKIVIYIVELIVLCPVLTRNIHLHYSYSYRLIDYVWSCS